MKKGLRFCGILRAEILLLSRFEIVSSVLADGALIISGELIAFKRFKVAADLADESLFLCDGHSRYIFKRILAVLAERTYIIIRQIMSFDKVSADGASPAFLLLIGSRLFLRLDVGMVVSIGCARRIGENLCLSDIGNEQGGNTEIDCLNDFASEYSICKLRDIADAVCQSVIVCDIRKLVGISSGLESEMLEEIERRVFCQNGNVELC